MTAICKVTVAGRQTISAERLFFVLARRLVLKRAVFCLFDRSQVGRGGFPCWAAAKRDHGFALACLKPYPVAEGDSNLLWLSAAGPSLRSKRRDVATHHNHRNRHRVGGGHLVGR